MAATNISAQAITTPYATAFTSLTWTAADTTNGNATAKVSDLILLAKNTNTSTAYTVTIGSVNLYNRPAPGPTGESIAASAIKIFRLSPTGWADTNDKYNFSSNNSAVEFAVVSLSAS